LFTPKRNICRKGKAKNFTYVWKENNEVKFDKLDECYEYYKQQTDKNAVSFATF